MPSLEKEMECRQCGTVFHHPHDAMDHTEVVIERDFGRAPIRVCVAPLCPDQPCALCALAPDPLEAEHVTGRCPVLRQMRDMHGMDHVSTLNGRCFNTREHMLITWMNCQRIAARGRIRNLREAQEVRHLADIMYSGDGTDYEGVPLLRAVSKWVMEAAEEEEWVEWDWDDEMGSRVRSREDALAKLCLTEGCVLDNFQNEEWVHVVGRWFVEFWTEVAAGLPEASAAAASIGEHCLSLRHTVLLMKRDIEDTRAALDELEALGEPSIHEARLMGGNAMFHLLGMLSRWVFALGENGRIGEALTMTQRALGVAEEQPFDPSVREMVENMVHTLLEAYHMANLPRGDLFPLIERWVALLMGNNEGDVQEDVEAIVRNFLTQEECAALFSFLGEELDVNWM